MSPTSLFYHTTLAAFCALALSVSGIEAADDAATPLVVEDFNYPIGASLAGQSGGKGLSGSWDRGYNGNGDGEIVARLTFSDYPVSGNAVRLAASSAANNNVIDLRPISADLGSAPQTVWMSYLYSYTVTPGTTPWFTSGMATQNNSWPDSTRGGLLGTNGGDKFAAVYQSSAGTGAENSNSASTTYLLIGKYAGGVSMTMWALTAADYDNIKTGGITEAKLDATNSGKMVNKFETGQEISLESYLSVFGATSGVDSSLSVTIGQILMGPNLKDVLNRAPNKP